MMRTRQLFAAATTSLALGLGVLLSGCSQGRPSTEPPIHLNPNMDKTARYNSQAHSPFFEDGATMRTPVAGTVARGHLREHQTSVTLPRLGVTLEGEAVHTYYTGNTLAGEFAAKTPVPVTLELLQRGRDRYEIYCLPCHGGTGDGQGLVVKRNAGLVPPPSFHEERLVAVGDGELYSAIANGVRTMPNYAAQVPVADRWAIVGYVRALQRSQRAAASDIPEAERRRLSP